MTTTLAAGEKLIWEGRPRGLRGFFRSMDVFLLGFAAFAAFFFVTSLAASARQTPRAPSDYVVVALFPFIAFGLFLFLPRLIGVWREASGASYALTDRRIIIEGRGRRVEFDLRTLPHLELERSWLSGPTIFFAQRGAYEGWGGFYGGSSAAAFRGLADAPDVYRMISEARSRAVER
jgi:hypothetical protein